MDFTMAFPTLDQLTLSSTCMERGVLRLTLRPLLTLTLMLRLTLTMDTMVMALAMAILTLMAMASPTGTANKLETEWKKSCDVEFCYIE
jgi:hypothetical protein